MFTHPLKDHTQQTGGRRRVKGQSTSSIVDRDMKIERHNLNNKYCCDSKFSTLIITLSLTLTLTLSSGRGPRVGVA